MKIADDSDTIKKRLKTYDASLTGEQLKISKDYSDENRKVLVKRFISEVDVYVKTQLILEIADEYVRSMEIENHSVCQKGCAFCCKIPVSVTAAEAGLIERHTETKSRKINVNAPSEYRYEYCPFLNKSEAFCSIYTVRPLSCRSFFTLDHYNYCEDVETTHLILTTSSSAYLQTLEKNLLILSNGLKADIKEWF
ncbi:YkgJ family cysteine cluster protein [Salmonella enterica subsp. enterica]|nr:YkgJ family cysteine cluster protein [Salmonella enterica subsp. enterica serovar Virchow]